ncbi:serine/threonine-protein kinase [Chaetomium tenue]|uniref:Serine/threonine-protein kinase n=1 Tax=Chaetomium tenue TaxID=1854479 RepID=A0ACB7P3Y5_9PEZI|nr:serine/threonine-protein kinase [Chaetomium globosum]
MPSKRHQTSSLLFPIRSASLIMVASHTVEGLEESPKADGKEISLVQSLQDLILVEFGKAGGEIGEMEYVTFKHITPEEEVYFGQSSKNKREITMEEFNSALQRLPDNEIFPEVPEDIPLTIAPDDLDDDSAFLKRPGLTSYDEDTKGTIFVRMATLQETVIMEQLSKEPHPYIIRYLGCRVRRGRITCIVLERLDRTLMQYVNEPEFGKLDRSRFLKALESAVAHVHALGLAHNDINPYNIMVKDGMPVLIDFGACQPLGLPLQERGTPGWSMDDITTSELEHDAYGLRKIREWLESFE